MVSMLRPSKTRGRSVMLDVAGGTGDIAFPHSRRRRPDRTQGDACSTSTASMLAVGRSAQRQNARFAGEHRFHRSQCRSLALRRHATFDAYTDRLRHSQCSTHRDVALKPRPTACSRRGGQAARARVCPSRYCPFSTSIYDAYSFSTSFLQSASLVTGDGEPYRYLVESIRTFPRPPIFARQIAAAGFRKVDYRVLSGGIANIHSAWKL